MSDACMERTVQTLLDRQEQAISEIERKKDELWGSLSLVSNEPSGPRNEPGPSPVTKVDTIMDILDAHHRRLQHLAGEFDAVLTELSKL